MSRRLQWILVRTAQRILTAATMHKRARVVDAPATQAELESLRKGIEGRWLWLGSIGERGNVETATLEASTTVLTFTRDGTMVHECYRGPRLLQARRATYRFEGRNVVTTHPAFPVLRADAWSRTELRLHWYRLSATVVLARLEDAPDEESSADALVKRTSWRPVPLRGEA